MLMMSKIDQMTTTSTVQQVAEYVVNQMTYHWDKGLHFHNLNHTIQVVNAAKKIGKILRLIPSEMEILEIAAWFHDTGYIISPDHHERASAQLASTVLIGMDYPNRLTRKVSQTIMATQFPQKPTNMLEKIICDADLYHLSTAQFPLMSENLRREKASFGLSYTKPKWTELNREFFAKHHYWTTFGRDVLTPAKEMNYRNFLAQ